VAIALLLVVLVFLYMKTRHVDEADYLHNVGTMWHLRQLDAQRELEVLKSRLGVRRDYDALAVASREMARLVPTLRAELHGNNHDEAATLEQARGLLAEAIRKQATLVEQFKSSNSVLRNSLAFLPTAAADVLQGMGPAASGTRSAAEHKAAAVVNSLLLSALLYSQEASDQRAAGIQSELAALNAVERLLPPTARERLAIFSAHVLIILREQKTVNDRVAAILAIPTADRIDDVRQALVREQQRSVAQSRKYREYLVMFSAAMAALLLYAGIQLLRQAETDRANRELHSVNEQLERRVQERTIELQSTQGELVATARRAGRAEIATNVLHNVGNILNSVNVSAGVIAQTLRRSRAQGLSRAVRMMDDHAGDLARFLTTHEKGRLLPAYLSGAAAGVAKEQQSMLDELQHLTRSIDHIKDVVSTQQSYAGGSSVVEPARLCELAEDALRMNAGALAQGEVTVIREFLEVPLARVDRARVLQILVNLISNARHAMEDCADRPHRIVLRVWADDTRLRVSVQDHGVGIAPENLTRIFSHGFTTRTAGHGFGLHSCALAARQMGGTLSVHSDGPGQGATFTLELPLDAVPAAA
jgi:signal transduction histidine kinase